MDARIDHHDETLAPLMEGLDKLSHLAYGKPLGIRGEVLAELHASQCRPRGLQRNARRRVVADDLGQVVRIPVAVPRIA